MTISRPPEVVPKPVSLSYDQSVPVPDSSLTAKESSFNVDQTGPTEANASYSATQSTSTSLALDVDTSVPLITSGQLPTGPRQMNVTLHLGLLITVDPQTGHVTATLKEADMDPAESHVFVPVMSELFNNI